MRIKEKHYQELKKSIDDRLNVNNNRVVITDHYKNLGLSKERFAWDLFYNTAEGLINKLTVYLNDSHIQTALFKIIREY